MFESFKNIFEISEKKLKLGGLYSRQNVHESFKQKTKFTKGSGYWGISGIVKPDKKKGNFIFFVTAGAEQANHSFDEFINENGNLKWQSQPSQRLDSPIIEELINHDDTKNFILIFLRNKKSDDYTYMGKLKYVFHIKDLECPVYFEWQLIDWSDVKEFTPSRFTAKKGKARDVAFLTDLQREKKEQEAKYVPSLREVQREDKIGDMPDTMQHIDKSIAELADQGQSVKEISNELNISRAKIQESLRIYFFGNKFNEEVTRKNLQLKSALLQKKIEFNEQKIIDLVEHGNGIRTIKEEIGFENLEEPRHALNKLYFNGGLKNDELTTKIYELIKSKNEQRKKESKINKSSKRVISFFEKHKKMLEMRNDGGTLEEIGQVYGLTRERIRQILKKLIDNGPYEGFTILTKEEIAKKKHTKYLNQRHDEYLKIKEEHESALIDAYNSGENTQQMSNDLNLGNAEVNGCLEILKKEGKISYFRPRKSQGPSKEELDLAYKTIVNMRERGSSREEIARVLGYSPIWVSQKIRQMRDEGIYIPDNHNMANREYLRDWDKINNRSQEILDLIESGVTKNSEIEKKLGLSSGAVSRHIKTYIKEEVDEALRKADKSL